MFLLKILYMAFNGLLGYQTIFEFTWLQILSVTDFFTMGMKLNCGKYPDNNSAFMDFNYSKSIIK